MGATSVETPPPITDAGSGPRLAPALALMAGTVVVFALIAVLRSHQVDVPFRDPAHLFVTPDHYVTRLLHASGIALEDLGVGQGPLSEAAARTAWRLLCSHWEAFRGTPVRYWLESELVEIFDVTVRPSATTADALYDHIAERLAMDAYRPRALFDRFKIELIATTEGPSDTLKHHEAIRASGWGGRVVTAYRPDAVIDVEDERFGPAMKVFAEVTGMDVYDWKQYLAAHRQRREDDDHDEVRDGERQDPLGERGAALARQPAQGEVEEGDEEVPADEDDEVGVSEEAEVDDVDDDDGGELADAMGSIRDNSSDTGLGCNPHLFNCSRMEEVFLVVTSILLITTIIGAP